MKAKIICSHCGCEFEKEVAHINRANKSGLNIYCNRFCAGLGRRNNQSIEEKRKAKSEYDRLFRAKNKEIIKKKKSDYAKSELGRELQKRQRTKRKENGKHAEYYRQPEQRHKEKIRRYIRLGQLQEKFCISCETKKPLIEFDCYTVFPDKRLYQCKECESKQKIELGCTTRGVMTAIVMRSNKMGGTLTRKDIAKHPYLIEANKYLILLKQLTK